MTQTNTPATKVPMKAPLEELFWAQDVLDYWLELGADPQELKKDINAEISEVAGEIYTYHYNTKQMLDTKLPNLMKWCRALEQINLIIDGPSEPIILDELWLRAKWGIFLDLPEGDCTLNKTDRIVPFLTVLEKEMGIIDVNELEKFLGCYWTYAECVSIMRDLYGENPKGLFRTIKTYHLTVNKEVLDVFFWGGVNGATKTQALLYEAKENGREEDIEFLQKELTKYTTIINSLTALDPDYEEEIIRDFFAPIQ